jgi:tellurite resistance protein
MARTETEWLNALRAADAKRQDDLLAAEIRRIDDVSRERQRAIELLANVDAANTIKAQLHSAQVVAIVAVLVAIAGVIAAIWHR